MVVPLVARVFIRYHTLVISRISTRGFILCANPKHLTANRGIIITEVVTFQAMAVRWRHI